MTGIVQTKSPSLKFKVTVESGLAPNTQAATREFTITNSAAEVLSFPSQVLGAATIGSPYFDQLQIAGGVPGYSWFVTNGALPPGLNLDPAAGSITGTPTSSGAYSLTVRVTDSASPTRSLSHSFHLTVGAQPASVTVSDTIAGATQWQPYSAQVLASGGTPPYTYSVTSGALPDGLTLDLSSGVLSGTPSTVQTARFTIAATDSAPHAKTVLDRATIRVSPPAALQMPDQTLPDAYAAVGYAASISAIGGTGGLTYEVTTGSLPAGISLDASTGTVFGTAHKAAVGTFTLGVTATDSATPSDSTTASITFSVKEFATLAAPNQAPPEAFEGTHYVYQFVGTGGLAPVHWAVTAGSLPPGLSLSSTGLVSGKPAVSGVYSFSATASDSVTPTAQTVSVPVNLTVHDPGGVSIATSSLDDAIMGKAYSVRLDVLGGEAPYTWSLSTGELPAGVHLNTQTGAISGDQPRRVCSPSSWK